MCLRPFKHENNWDLLKQVFKPGVASYFNNAGFKSVARDDGKKCSHEWDALKKFVRKNIERT